MGVILIATGWGLTMAIIYHAWNLGRLADEWSRANNLWTSDLSIRRPLAIGVREYQSRRD